MLFVIISIITFRTQRGCLIIQRRVEQDHQMNCRYNDFQCGNDEGSRMQPGDKSTPDGFKTFHACRINPNICPGVTAAVRGRAHCVGYTAMAFNSSWWRGLHLPSWEYKICIWLRQVLSESRRAHKLSSSHPAHPVQGKTCKQRCFSFFPLYPGFALVIELTPN